MVIMNYNKYENYIRVGHQATQDGNGNWVCSDLQDFPTPSTFGRTLHDVDVDAYTDLEGYTQRNRVRHDVEDIALAYGIVSDEDENYILNRISPEYIYVELIDKKERTNVTDTHGYKKYTKSNAFYWYDSANNKMYNSSYVEVSPFTLSEYTAIMCPAKKVHRMYASDKEWDTFAIVKDSDGTWHTQDIEFGFSLVEQ